MRSGHLAGLFTIVVTLGAPVLAGDATTLTNGVSIRIVELGEGLEGAVRREVREETGLTVAILGVTAVLDRIYRDKEERVAYHYVLIDFACE